MDVLFDERHVGRVHGSLQIADAMQEIFVGAVQEDIEDCEMGTLHA